MIYSIVTLRGTHFRVGEEITNLKGKIIVSSIKKDEWEDNVNGLPHPLYYEVNFSNGSFTQIPYHAVELVTHSFS